MASAQYYIADTPEVQAAKAQFAAAYNAAARAAATASYQVKTGNVPQNRKKKFLWSLPLLFVKGFSKLSFPLKAVYVQFRSVTFPKLLDTRHVFVVNAHCTFAYAEMYLSHMSTFSYLYFLGHE